MIIPNGTIEIKHKVVGGIDPLTGYPTKALSATWGAPIPCQYKANTRNDLGRINGERFTLASYAILIEGQDLEATQLRLSNAQGKVIGEYTIISTEPLQAVGQIRILV